MFAFVRGLADGLPLRSCRVAGAEALPRPAPTHRAADPSLQRIFVRTSTTVTRLHVTAPGRTVSLATLDAKGVSAQHDFDAVVVCTPAPVASALLRAAGTGCVPGKVTTFVDTQRYRSSVHASFLVKASDFNRVKPPAATMVPSTLLPPLPEELRGCEPWIANAVACITFPSGKLEAPAPPGSEIITVYLSADASAHVLEHFGPQSSLRATELPATPNVPASSSSLPAWMKRQLNERTLNSGRRASAPPPPGIDATSDAALSKRKVEVAEFVWSVARFAAAGMLPQEFTHILDVRGFEFGWADFPVPSSTGGAAEGVAGAGDLDPAVCTGQGPGRFEACVDAILAQRAAVAKSGTRILFAGDYMGGGTAEGAVRSAAWAVGALLQAVEAPGVFRSHSDEADDTPCDTADIPVPRQTGVNEHTRGLRQRR